VVAPNNAFLFTFAAIRNNISLLAAASNRILEPVFSRRITQPESIARRTTDSLAANMFSANIFSTERRVGPLHRPIEGDWTA